MKKLYMLCLTLLLILSFSNTALAGYSAPGSGTPKPAEQPASPSDGGDGDHPEEGDGGGEPDDGEDSVPEEPNILSYTPVVTALHSVNAAFIENDTAVYFLPALEDFPVDLKSTCADLTTDDGKQHKFAIVYDGYFDTEVKYFQATSGDNNTTRMQTSKKVFSSTDNSRCLNLLGYDLLLADETCNIQSGDGVINFDYVPTIVGKNKLTAKTCIMDLYKAVGAYEWDIKITYGKDISDLAVNTSPIMQDLVVLTNDERPGGIDTEEGATWVWASRTNPNQYWARCKKDAIFDGGAHKYTKENYIGNKTSCTFSKNETEYVTMAEFCVMARAIMELYGEPVITQDQINNMIQLYALELPSANYNEEQREAIEYLSAKGIIDPAAIEFDKHVTFQDIEEILLRIADEDSRIIVQSQANFANALVQAGFVETTLSDNLTAAESFEEISNPYDDNMLDYVVEAVDGYTNFYVRTINETDYLTPEGLAEDAETATGTDTATGSTRYATSSEGPVYGLNVSMLTGAEVSDDFLFACDSIRVRTPGGDVGTTPGSGYFDFLGLEDYDGKQYYHFRIDKDLPSIEIYYDTGTTNTGASSDVEGTHVVKELQGITSYTLTPGGGVYNFSNGTEERVTFDDANFSYNYIDATRINEDVYNLAETESYLSKYTWILMSWNKGNFTQSNLKGIQYKNPSNKNDVVSFSDFAIEQVDKAYTYDFADGKHTFFTKGLSSSTGGTDKDKVYVLAQVPVDYNTFNSRMVWNGNSNTKVSESKAYYRYDDDTLLVPFSYLKSTGLCSAMTFPDNDTLILTLSKYANTNVTLNNKYKLIVVGDTIMKDDSSVMFYKDPDNEVYINFRACLGWGNQYVVVNSAEGSLPVLNNSDIIGTKYSMAISCKSVKNYYPDNSFNVSWGSQKVTVNGYQPSGTTAGFAMTGTNPFGNYILFENEADQDNDVLFMVKRDDVVSPGGAKVSGAATDAARSEFKNLTGVSIDIPDGFSMYYAYLSKNGTGNFKNIHYTYKTKYSSGKVDLGYVYIPKSYSSVNDAINEYVGDTSGTILPLAMVNNTFINLNMNTCKDSAGGEQLAMGTMPYALASKTYKGNCFGVINKQGKVEENTSATYDSLANCVILAAPVGMFSGIKGFKPMPYQNISNKLFYGNEPVKFMNGDLMINGIVKVKPDTNVANCTYLTAASGGLYVICSDSTMLVTDGETDELAPEMIITEPETLVDWGAYKFGRLVENLDSWSSIALIFILNVLPRVAMILFFVLMLLSLIKDVRPWRMFCQKVFDIYSFLTFGRQNVDTIDMKRVFIVSLICFSLFLMIMDGLLFEVIIWFCRFFIALWQH